MSELSRQGVPRPILNAIQANRKDIHTPTMRAKRAVACLYWISPTPLNDIERTLMQFDRSNSAAGEIRSVAQRTVDLFTAVTRVVEILHPGTNLGERRERLMTRLELGVPSEAANLGTIVGSQIGRADYLSLVKAGVGDPQALRDADDQKVLDCLNGNRTKLVAIREALAEHPVEPATETTPLPAYKD
jgi:hypothetical protein